MERAAAHHQPERVGCATPTLRLSARSAAACTVTLMLILGLDGGGTSTKAVLADVQTEAVTVVGMGIAGGSNVNSVGLEAAQRALRAAVEQALGTVPAGQLTAGALAVAGGAAVREATALWHEMVPGTPSWIGNDLPAAFSSGTRRGSAWSPSPGLAR
jgi:N-acetylglucosamine kinase-like BadF-type ATPase